MGSLSVVLRTIFRPKAVSKALKSSSVAEILKTTSSYNASTGITTSKREFNFITKHGMDYLHLVQNESKVLPDGAKVSRSHVWGKSNTEWDKYNFGFGGDAIDRTKSITCEPNNILGGKTITIKKDYRNTFGDRGRNETLVKMYDSDGVLQHKELTIDYTNGSGYKVRATQDRVNSDLNSSAADMLKKPNTHIDCKHELTESNYSGLYEASSNHSNFLDNGTAYSRAVEANEAAVRAKIAAEQAQKAAAEQAEKTAKLAAEKAAKELKASRPRVNVGKVLGLNIDELKVAKRAFNGGIERCYYRPGIAPGKEPPVIRTFDCGLRHQEWIRNLKNGKFIYMKQLGEECPYIVYKDGNYMQVQHSGIRGRIVKGHPELYREYVPGLNQQWIPDSKGELNYIHNRHVYTDCYGRPYGITESDENKAYIDLLDLVDSFTAYEK